MICKELYAYIVLLIQRSMSNTKQIVYRSNLERKFTYTVTEMIVSHNGREELSIPYNPLTSPEYTDTFQIFLNELIK